MENAFNRLSLEYNPFEPAASGIPVSGSLWIPDRWRLPLEKFLDTMQNARGPKAFAILGEYGSGKTYLLRWLERAALPDRRIRPFFFDNPGAQFYDLANSLLRQIGRNDFAKSLWEYLDPRIRTVPMKMPGFEDSFQNWLWTIKRTRQQQSAIGALAATAQEKGITQDEEIAHKSGKFNTVKASQFSNAP